MQYIPARQAHICWNPNGDIAVNHIDSDDENEHLLKSGGACFEYWKRSSPDELYFRLLQQIWELVICEGIEPTKLHRAFKAIPEYRATLPSDHPDVLPAEATNLLEQPLPRFDLRCL